MLYIELSLPLGEVWNPMISSGCGNGSSVGWETNISSQSRMKLAVNLDKRAVVKKIGRGSHASRGNLPSEWPCQWESESAQLLPSEFQTDEIGRTTPVVKRLVGYGVEVDGPLSFDKVGHCVVTVGDNDAFIVVEDGIGEDFE